VNVPSSYYYLLTYAYLVTAMYKYFDYCHTLKGVTRSYKHLYRFSIFYKHVIPNRGQWREGEVWFSCMGATVRKHHSMRQKKKPLQVPLFFRNCRSSYVLFCGYIRDVFQLPSILFYSSEGSCCNLKFVECCTDIINFMFMVPCIADLY